MRDLFFAYGIAALLELVVIAAVLLVDAMAYRWLRDRQWTGYRKT